MGSGEPGHMPGKKRLVSLKIWAADMGRVTGCVTEFVLEATSPLTALLALLSGTALASALLLAKLSPQ